MTEEKKFYPVAVDAPETDVTPLTLTMVGNLLAQSRESPRKRILQKLHKSHGAGVHRMFNAMQPGTYVTPHRHLQPAKDETILIVAGAMLVIQFSDDGKIVSHTLLQPGTENFGIDVAPHVYHTYIILKADTLIFEVKDGPYESETDKDFPAWAPLEGSEEAEPYLLEIIKELAERANAAVEAAKAAEAAEEQTEPAE
jgi:cupin fold WbuC family metalloprotein